MMLQVLDPSCLLWAILQLYVSTLLCLIPLTICLLYSLLRLIKCNDASEASILCSLAGCAFYGIVVSSLWKDDMDQQGRHNGTSTHSADRKFQRPIVLDVDTWHPDHPTVTTCPSTTCPVCLEFYQPGDAISVGPTCRHVFHADCIGRWTALGHSTCPCCRHDWQATRVTRVPTLVAP